MVAVAQSVGVGDAEADLLALHVAAGLGGAGDLVDPGLGEERVAGLLARRGHAQEQATKTTVIAARMAQPWRVSPTIRPKV